jgi:exodeoxyribonuclease VIII
VAQSLKKSFEEYLAIRAQNFSLLKEMAKSPLHYKFRSENPREDSTGLARGRAIHTAVLEPEMFMREYVIFPGKTRRGKEWDEFALANADKTILKNDEYDKAWAAAAAVRRHPEVQALMRDGVSEKSFTWKDKGTGLKCKCRVDWIGNALFDLKSTSDVHERIFGRLAARMLYHAQAAMYFDGSKHKGPAYIIAVEAEPPHDVAVFELTEDDLLAGRETYQGFLRQVKECRESGVWPGRYPEKTRLALPKYVFEDEGQGDGSFEIVQEVA